MLWRVLEQVPYEGGFIWFRTMSKPTDPKELRLRLDWGVFPKSEKIFLPRYDSVPENSPIRKALEESEERLFRDVKLDFGSLRGKWNLIAKVMGQAVLTILIPKEIDPDTLPNRRKNCSLLGFM